MTQEEKSLLLKDLCARIPYDPFIAEGESKVPIKLGYIVDLYPQGYSKFLDVRLHNAKPYLRPMSSMTEEEKKNWLKSIHHYNFKGQLCLTHIESYDWLNAHHFDFRNLIERRLAIAVTEENNPYKE